MNAQITLPQRAQRKPAVGVRYFAVAFLLAVCLTAISTSAKAQDDNSLPTQTVSISLRNAPIREALDALFKSANLQYTLDQSVDRNITVNLHDVPFAIAFRTLLRSSTPQLQYTVSNGVYQISQPAEDSTTTPTSSSASPGGYYANSSGNAGSASNMTQVASSTGQQVVPIYLNYIGGSLLRFIVGPIVDILPQYVTPGAGTQSGVNGAAGNRNGIGGVGTGSTVGGIGGTQGGLGGSYGTSGGYGNGIGSTGGFGGGFR